MRINERTLTILLAIFAIVISILALAKPAEITATPRLGVTNFDSVHLRDTNGTATPNFIADQVGTGVIAEFRDNATPVALFPNGGGLTINSGGLTVTAGGATLTAGDLTITAGGVNYAPQSEVVVAGFQISATTTGLLSLTSATEVTSSTSIGIITTTATSGDVLILANNNASDEIHIDGTGGSIECKSNVDLGASDTLTLWYNGTDEVWNCIANYDNS